MAAQHEHQHGGEHLRARNRRALVAALAITVAFALTEVVGGLLTGSLALLADAGHMLTDVLALGLGLFAAWVAGRPSTPQKTYGYYRAEILAALVNGALLILIAGGIIWQAVVRLSQPHPVASGPMLAIAAAGLAANLASAGILVHGGAGTSLNVRGALLHVASDAVGSVGAMAAALVILLTGWSEADALASLLIAGLILIGSWQLVREAVNILLEGVPSSVDLSKLQRAMSGVPGVAGVHDVHVWTVTSGFIAMSAHAELDGSRDAHAVLDDLTRLLAERFHISHTTIQPEPADHTAVCCTLVHEPSGPIH